MRSLDDFFYESFIIYEGQLSENNSSKVSEIFSYHGSVCSLWSHWLNWSASLSFGLREGRLLKIGFLGVDPGEILSIAHVIKVITQDYSSNFSLIGDSDKYLRPINFSMLNH